MSSDSNSGEIVGLHYAAKKPIRLQWRNGTITEVEADGVRPSSGAAMTELAIAREKRDAADSSNVSAPEDGRTPQIWLAPALFDLQINGYGGVDFQQDNLTADDLLTAVRRLCAAGCAQFLLTLITDEWPKLIARLRHLRSLRLQSAELQAAIAGWHIEGPFLSTEPGFHGAHDPTLMCDPTPAHILELRAITGDDPVLLTLSPERNGSIAAIELAVSRGIKVSLGHTNASADVLKAAVAAGATAFTHLGNGCPRELDRHDNILWRVFDMSGLTVNLIPDQIHVSPPLFRLAHWVLGGDSIYYTTDAMSAGGMPPGRYPLGKWQLQVGADQIVRQPGKPLFAGSALCPIDGIFRAAQMLNCPWQKVWPRFSEIPAKLLGLRNTLAVGQPANFCALKVTERNELLELQSYSGGRMGPRTDLFLRTAVVRTAVVKISENRRE